MTEIAKEFWAQSLTMLPPDETDAFRAAMEQGAHARGLRLRPGTAIETVRAATPKTLPRIRSATPSRSAMRAACAFM